MPPLIPYNKPSLTFQEQLELLRSRGLIVNDEPKALHLLESLSYYRLSGYWYPLLEDIPNHIFKANITFQDGFDLYCFDRELRLLVLGELEKIEIALRAQMIYVLSHAFDPFWFMNSDLFSDSDTHRTTIVKISNEYRRSDSVFIQDFRRKYSNVYPPSWITLEILSMGTLSMLYKNLKPTFHKKAIARHFGMNIQVLTSWLHSLSYIRNTCAHHSRLWNKHLGVQPQRLQRPRLQWLNNSDVSNKKIYYTLSMILFFLQTINPQSTFNTRFKQLHSKYSNIDLSFMGFPTDWEIEPLWR